MLTVPRIMTPVMESNDPKERALRVVSVLRDSAMDGYRLMSRTSLDEDSLVATLLDLQSIIGVKGELSRDKVGAAYLFVRPDARQMADMMLASRLYKG